MMMMRMSSSSSSSSSSFNRRRPSAAIFLLLLVSILAVAPGTCFVLSTGTTAASASTISNRRYHSVLYASTQTKSSSTASRSSSSTRSTQQSNKKTQKKQKHFQHALAILAMPYTSVDRIVNERILETVMASRAQKLSIVLRCEGNHAPPSLATLRKYVGEVYSQLWDTCMGESENSSDHHIHLPDVVVYPQNLPNTAPESWIDIQPDLDCVCTQDALCGWISMEATGRGQQFQTKASQGRGGLLEHVEALNAERVSRNLKPVAALHVPDQEECPLDIEEQAQMVTFMDDEEDEQSTVYSMQRQQQASSSSQEPTNGSSSSNLGSIQPDNDLMLSGPRVSSSKLYDGVAVGGTFDGLHFGHRKLLTLAVSSLNPMTGRLTIGITKDEMLRHKQYANYIPPLQERMAGLRTFLHRLAPGILNRVKLVPIGDKFGPPGHPETAKDYDALVLSHETLQTGFELNRHRQEVLGLPPLQLLCTRRTEAQGMSSTTLRRLRQRNDDNDAAAAAAAAAKPNNKK